MKEENFLKRLGNPKLAEFSFDIDEDGNPIRVSLAKPYESVDELVRPHSMRAENPDEFYN